MAYGPQNTYPWPAHTDQRVSLVPGQHARKIRHDLERWARIYTGTQFRLFSLSGRAERCPNCINALTGANMIAHCAICKGTGYTLGYENLGDYWMIAQFSPRVFPSTEQGNTDNPGLRDAFVVIGAPLLSDKDLLITLMSKEVFKVIDQLPLIASTGGEIVTQNAGCSRLTPGSTEYHLIDW